MILTQLLLPILLTTPVWQEQRYVLSVDVELINVTATVIDEYDRYIEGLMADDFQLLEDGREQKISFFSHDTNVPISIAVLIDTSGSLQNKLRQGLQVVSEIAATLSGNDEMLVITFNSRAQVRQKFTSSQEEIRRSLLNIRTGGETAVYDAISLGLQEMKYAKHKKRILLLLSDCFDTRSKIKAEQAEDLLKRSDTLVYAIGIDDADGDPRTRKRPRYHIYEYMLGKLTRAGGGRLIRLYTGHEYDLRSLAETVVGELHQEYTMGYYPVQGLENPGLRSIQVRVAKPGARVLGEKLHFLRRD
jgi:Ca-activated chloride channel family protein